MALAICDDILIEGEVLNSVLQTETVFQGVEKAGLKQSPEPALNKRERSGSTTEFHD